MRKGFLGLLGGLSVGAGSALAQPAPGSPYLPSRIAYVAPLLRAATPPAAPAETTPELTVPSADSPGPGTGPVFVTPRVVFPISLKPDTPAAETSVAPKPVELKSELAPYPQPAEPKLEAPQPAEPRPAELIPPPMASPVPPAVVVDGPGCKEAPADRVWFNADYLMWWVKGAPVPVPLVTTGPTPNVNGLQGGVIGQPDTTVLYGLSSQQYGMLNGMRLDAGMWLDIDHRWAVEAGYFALERGTTSFSASSDATGNPALSFPLVNTGSGVFNPTVGESVIILSSPGLFVGSVDIATHLRMQGWEVNGEYNAIRRGNWNLDLLAGFRAINLDEDLQIATNSTSLPNGGGLLFPPNGILAPITDPTASETTFDRFATQNHFYGLQLGGQLEWKPGRFSATLLGKVALGVNQQLAVVDGNTSLIIPGTATQTVPGGIYTLPSNIGRYFRDQFSVAPEFGLDLGYQLTSHLDAHVGYTFLYLNNVIRPGNQIDRVVDAGLVPINFDPTAVSTGRPAFQFHSTDYWAQGLNLGLLFHY